MQTPVLLIHFNRPDSTARQLELLSKVAPARVWVLCDGPRAGRGGEAEAVAQVRAQLEDLPWACAVNYCFREDNLGVCENISRGISWFLEECGAGIILEDDCLPSESFFPFMTEMLERYSGEDEVMCVSGFTGRGRPYPMSASYGFSNYFSCWGWATWNSAWKKYDPDLSAFTDRERWRGIGSRLLHGLRPRLYWKMILRRVLRGVSDSWAYRFQLSIWGSRGLAVTPKTNLVVNVGFGAEATNTAGLGHFDSVANEIAFPLQHPEQIKADRRIDDWIEDHWHSKSFRIRLKWLVAKLRSRSEDKA